MSNTDRSHLRLGNPPLKGLRWKWLMFVMGCSVMAFLLLRMASPKSSSNTADVLLPTATLAISAKPIPIAPTRNQAASSEPQPPLPEPSKPRPRLGQDITIHLTGLKLQESNVYIAMFESVTGFPHELDSAETTKLPATNTQMKLTVPQLTGLSRAIAVFQDLDGNGQLSKNALGIPTEPYGFSNNVRGVLGPPTFQEAVIRFENVTGPLEIRIR